MGSEAAGRGALSTLVSTDLNLLTSIAPTQTDRLACGQAKPSLCLRADIRAPCVSFGATSHSSQQPRAVAQQQVFQPKAPGAVFRKGLPFF